MRQPRLHCVFFSFSGGKKNKMNNIARATDVKFMQLVKYMAECYQFNSRTVTAEFAQVVTPSCGTKTWRARFALNHDEHRIVFSRDT